MLTSDELIRQISITMGKTKVLKLTVILRKRRFAFTDLVDITFHPDKHVAFRAAWILERLFLEKQESYLEDMDYVLSRMKDVTNLSCKRHYAKIVMHITSPKASAKIQEKLADFDLEPVVEQLFDWLIDPKTLVAIKVFAAQALFHLRIRYPWITEELANQIQFLMRDGSAAIQSRGKRLLSQL